ncbi:hypothetical protein C8J57DRAFT_1585851 [Mycena rebaudengoi]|nr:hypothetical protein C8J57DRAFT_1585851 [Mycena rebaudengoi]
MADPITITTTIITLATFIKDLIDVGQNIRRSIEKVGENRRRIREVVDDILGTLAQLANLSRGREDSFQAQELLDALGNLKADMLHVLSVAQKISAPEPRSGFRGLQSQFKGWLEREDVEVQVKRLNKHVKKCYIQFTAFSAARIEHTSARIENTSARIENTSVRVEQRLIINSVEHQAKLQRLEGMMTRVLVQTQFGHDVVNRTMEIVASAMHLVDAFRKYTTSAYFRSETPHWDPVEEPQKIVFLRPKSDLHILQKILTVMLQIKDHPTALSTKYATEILLNLGAELSSLRMQSEAMAADALAVQVFRHLASGENFAGSLPRLAFALERLSDQYQYQLRHELAVQAGEQSVYWCHVASEGEPDADNRALLLMSLNTHSTGLRAAGQIDAAIAVAQEALVLCRALLPETFQMASTEPDWALQYPEYEFRAYKCVQSFFCLSDALSDASRHREAFLASKEGLEVVARFAGAIGPPSGSNIDAFFNHMCKMAEAGDLPQDSLADAVILYGRLSRIYTREFLEKFLLILYAHAYFFSHDTAAIKDLRLFLEPSYKSPPPIMDKCTSLSWIDGWVVENAVRAYYRGVGFDAIQIFIAHLIQMHFEIAIPVLRERVPSPNDNWFSHGITFNRTSRVIMELSHRERLLVLESFAELVVYARKSIHSSLSLSKKADLTEFLSSYCDMLRQTVGCLSDALAISQDAVRSQTTPPSHEANWHEFYWLGLQALVLADMGRFPEAEFILRDAAQSRPYDDDDPSLGCLFTVVESFFLRQTGRKRQAVVLLKRRTSHLKSEEDVDTLIECVYYFLLSDLSSTQLEVGKTQAAFETAESTVIKCRELRTSHPHELQPQLAVAHALIAQSNCFAALGRAEEGLAAAQEAAAIYAGPPWRGFCPAYYRPQEFSSTAFHTLSLRLATLGHRDEALVNAEKAVEEYRELVSLAIGHTPPLAVGLRNLASRLWDVGRFDESIIALKEATSLLRGVADQLPHHFPTLADALEQLAEYLSVRGDAEGSSTTASECALIRERLVSKEGETEAESDSEFWDAEQGSGPSGEEVVSEGAALAVTAQTESDHGCRISPSQAEEIQLSPPESAGASASMVEPETSPAAQQGVAPKEQAEVPAAEKIDVGKRFKIKIELESSPLDVVWILLALLGLGWALALLRK